jgi:hypothetical protein
LYVPFRSVAIGSGQCRSRAEHPPRCSLPPLPEGGSLDSGALIRGEKREAANAA